MKPDIRVVLASLGGGGAERVTAILANEWVKLGLRPEVVLVRSRGVHASTLPPAVAIKCLHASRAVTGFPRLFRHLRSERVPTLVIGAEYGIGTMFAKRLGLLSAPVIYRESNSPRFNVSPAMQRGYPWLIAHADRVIAQNRAIEGELHSLGIPRDRIAVISNPISDHLLAAPLRIKDQGGENDLKTILGIGRLEKQKGFDRLIVAFATAYRADFRLRLVILGEGTQRARLEALVAELGLRSVVTLAGFAADPIDWLRRADLFALASHFEGQPNAVMEAIAVGCPVICATGGGGAAELMIGCGLQDCLIPGTDFTRDFGAAVARALARPMGYWVSARERLLQLCAPQRVAIEYLNACGIAIAPAAAAY